MTVVVVTGASSGVGRATARAFAGQGARLALLARNEDGLAGARAEVEAAGGEALVVPTDVGDAAQVEAAAARVDEELGLPDVWVNCAMVSVFSPVWELEPDEARRVTEVTYLGYVYGTLSALRRMRPRDRGTIVQVGSALAYRGIPLQALYCGAKHAIQGFTESLRCELIHEGSGVRVTQVHLPALNTPQFQTVKTRLPGHPHPVPPIFEPEVAADSIVWAAEHAPRELWVALSTVQAILGNRVAPGLLDRYLARSAWDDQQTEDPVEPHRRHNLWGPVPGDRGAHGPFTEEAKPRSIQLELRKRAAPLLAGAGVAAAGAAWAALRAR